MIPSEITVTVKDEERRLTSKTLCYEKYSVDDNDPIIKDCIARALKDFATDPSGIKVKITMEIL